VTELRFTEYALTEAQMRALSWLPADGSWRTKPGRLVAALNSLSLGVSGSVAMRQGNFGPRGGYEQKWCLTDAGRTMRARVFPETT